MKTARLLALTGSAGLVISIMAAMAGPAGAASAPHRVLLPGSLTPAGERAHPAGTAAADSQVRFDLVLKLRDSAGARRLAQLVSTPGSAEYRHYLSDAAWIARFSPAMSDVATAESWLHSSGFSIVSVPRDRLFIAAQGSVKSVERAFGVRLGYYKVNGYKVRLASNALSIPASVAGVISGVAGVNQYPATTGLALARAAVSAAKPGREPAPPPGFRNPQPCSAYWGQKIDTSDSPKLYAPYAHPLPYDICGYKPAQLRGAYQLAGRVARGNDGSGVTLAIVDAYDSPTLLTDAQKYFRLNDPAHPLLTSQFTNLTPATVDDQQLCDGSGWYDEQALDVEASHAMAPGAHILYVGAQDCLDTSLLAAVNTAITSGASGVSVLFSSGDSGDNFADFGLTAPNYPASSPYITAVGGTTLEVNARNVRQAEYGWSTAKQTLCESKTTSCGTATTPAGSLAFQAGGGGGTSYYYAEPYYQVPVVPAALADRNIAVTGAPARVV